MAAGRVFVVFRTRNPANVIFGIVVPSKLRIVLRDELHPIIVDEDVGTATLHLVHRYRSLERFDRRHDNGTKTLLEDRALNGDMRKSLRALLRSDRWHARIVFRVAFRLTDGPDELSNASHDTLEEEKSEPGL